MNTHKGQTHGHDNTLSLLLFQNKKTRSKSRAKIDDTLCPCCLRGLLHAYEAIHGVSPSPIFGQFSKILEHLYHSHTIYLLLEFYCTTEGLKVSENLKKFVISDLYFYHIAITLLSNQVIFKYFCYCY
jgi:hypothetical protein